MPDNPRGYCSRALHGAYTEMAGGRNWFRAMQSAQTAPSRYDWHDQGIKLFDRWSETNHDFRGITKEIIYHQRASLRDSLKGIVAYTGHNLVLNRQLLTMDTPGPGGSTTRAQIIQEPSDAYAEFDELDALRQRMQRLWPLLTLRLREVAMVMWVYTDPPANDIAAMLDTSTEAVYAAQTKIRKIAKGAKV